MSTHAMRGLRRDQVRGPLLVLVLVVAAAAIAGYFIGAATRGDEQVTASGPGGTIRAANGSLTYPASWKPTAKIPAIAGLSLRDPEALELTGIDGVKLVIGTTTAFWPTYLPTAFRNKLEEVPQAEQVVLAGDAETAALRYGDLQGKGAGDLSTLFVLPTDKGVSYVGCFAPESEADAALPACELVASTLRLTGARSIPINLSASFETDARRALSRLDARLVDLGPAMRQADKPLEQSRVARRLEAVYEQATTALGAAAKSEADRTAAAPLQRALALATAAYASMGATAKAKNAPAYTLAAQDARAAELQVSRAIDQLRAGVGSA